MNKITLNNKEYELPELNFGAMRKLGKLGFNITDMKIVEENPFEFLSILVSYITNTSIEEADKIIDESFTNANELNELIKTLMDWVMSSDFFKKMQAN